MKALWKGSGTYGLANAGIAGAQFVSILVFAAALPPDGFGYVSIFAVLTVVLSMVTGMGLSAAAQQAFFKLPLEDFKYLVSSIVLAVFLVAMVLALAMLLLPSTLLSYLNLPRPWVLLALCVATAQVLVHLLLTVLQTREQIGTYLATVTLQVAIGLTSAGAFYAQRSTLWQGALLTQAAAPLLTSAWALHVLSRSGCLRRRFDAALLRKALAYGLPLVPHQVAGWAISMVDRFIIASSFGIAQAGVYSLSFQIAQATNIVSNSVNQALVPVLFRRLADDGLDRSRLMSINMLYGVVLAFLSAVFFAGFMLLAPRLLSPAYEAAMDYTPWLIVAFFLLAVSRIASNFLLFHGRTGVLALSTLCVAAVSMTANILVVPALGVIGACWTSAAAFLLLLVVTSWQATICHRKSL